MADFRKIVAWQKADELVVLVYQMTKDFPDGERYGLTSQLRRAIVSVPANIAEGAGRQTLKDFRQFLFNSRGSLHEVEYYIHLAGRLGYLNADQMEQLDTVRRETARTLQGLIDWTTREMEAGRRNL